MEKIYLLKELEAPKGIAQLNSPFEEFKQDVSIVTVRLRNGDLYERVMLLYPNYIIAIAECEELPFKPSEIVEIFQAPQKQRRHKDSNWVYWYDHTQAI